MTRMRSFPFAAGVTVVAVLVAASLWVLWPFWLELVPVEPLILLVGGTAALSVGRAAYRVVLSSLLLIVAMAAQFLITAITTTQAPGCGGVVSNSVLAVVFAPLLVESMPAIPALIVIGAPAFAYAVLPRRPLLVRMGAIAVLLLLLGGVTAVVTEIRSGYSTTHCIEL